MSGDQQTEAFQHVHGRNFNAAATTYNLPSDATEWKRLDLQHNTISLAFGGLYPMPQFVEEMLESIQGDGPLRILDVACGSGIWAYEVAIRFPHAQVLGIDVSPVPLASSAPPNLTFVQEDVNQGLSSHFDQFHLVHLRCFTAGIQDLPTTFGNIVRCLKPGGLLVVVCPDWVTDETGQRYLKMAWVEGDEDTSGVSKEGSWFQRMAYESTDRARLAGSRYATQHGWYDGSCWNSELVDHENTISGSMYIPIGEWAEGCDTEETQLVRQVGSLLQQNLVSATSAWGPLLVSSGIDKDLVDEWIDKTQQELCAKTSRITMRFQFSLAQRKRLEGSVLPGLPTILPACQWSALEIYHDRKRALARMEKRQHSLGVLPTSMVSKALEKKEESTQENLA